MYWYMNKLDVSLVAYEIHNVEWRSYDEQAKQKKILFNGNQIERADNEDFYTRAITDWFAFGHIWSQ
jgi:hypothetical protein